MKRNPGGRNLKKRLELILLREPWDETLPEISQLPPKQSINALISFFCSLNPLLKWRAVSATGTVISALADHNLEEARVIMRRLMWMLNEESGGIGWGVPEAMGEIMAKSPILSGEYNRIIVSYADEGGNYIEHEPLQNGLLWAIHRLADVFPDRVAQAAPLTRPHLFSSDPEKRGLACLIAGHLRDDGARERLEEMLNDETLFSLYTEGYLRHYPIKNSVENALNRIYKNVTIEKFLS